ncbi:hypothetical protein ACFLT4_05265 [Chloroflexota bacterium]
MPPIFKALASITAWILFIGGCIALVVTTINWLVITGFIGTPPIAAFLGWGLAAAEFVLAVCVMKLRQMLE